MDAVAQNPRDQNIVILVYLPLTESNTQAMFKVDIVHILMEDTTKVDKT